MIVKELKEKLAEVPDHLQVCIMNINIEDDESCPTFELISVEEMANEKSQSFLTLQFADSNYIDKNVDITVE